MSNITTQFEKLKSGAVKMRASTAADRNALLKKLWESLVDHQEAIFAAAKKERNSHKLDAAAELVMIKGELDFISKNLKKWMKPKKVPNSLATMGKRCEIRHDPKGVVLNLSAWNAQIAECFIPAIAAIAAGNTIAIKPSELAPHSAQVVEDIVKEVFTDDQVAVCQGDAAVAQELLAQPFNHIYYTGGYTVGALVMKAAADHCASITLEMGGKSPVIIDKSANLEDTATKLSWGRVMNAGQVCIAPEYVIAHESVADELVEKLKVKMQEQYNPTQAGFENSENMNCIINERHHQRIVGLIDDAVEKGAKVAFGGNNFPEKRIIEPTILTHISEDMTIMQQEVFGPVLAVLTFKEREEVPEIISRRPNPLAYYVYCTDKENIEYYLSTCNSGSAVVNNNCIQSGTNPHLPFGGTGASGMGRIGGYRGFEEMSNARSVVHQPLDRFRNFLINLPPYSKRYEGLIMSGIKK